ncbi:poly(ethylene terephthalate) hydrolase family protein [Duganella levis]|uniref:Prolyl oligopeptidase family serine peptidase n=1 Tax=Duganella levis TaxID=2692169 RepID=A0ABW9W6A5_9BURK|nr:prolyl oligopeptidase family serine peptidase [Duganella levis]MYN29247.1 prolyl oligopeptidase family serine peptidase [Duganella levis]
MRYFLLVLLAALAPLVRAETGFANLERGPHGVGFRLVQQYDYSRSYREKNDVVNGQPFTGERARPVQTLIWYPAASNAGTRLPYSDYIRTEATDIDFGRAKSEVDAFVANQLKSAVAAIGETQAKAKFAQRMWAVRDAAPLAGKYPVVVYAPGGGSAAHEAADVGEYLASHGYVVIVSRNLGTRSYLMTVDREGAETQARDISFLVSYAHALPFADTAHIAAAGWSWGGMTNLFAAAADNRISAVISLDGTREPDLTKMLPVSRLTIPWLYISRKLATISELNKRGIESSFSLLNAARHMQLYQVVMQPMVHVDFSPEALRFQPPSHFEEYTREEVEQAYYWTARYMLAFVDAYLKNDAAGLAFVQRSPTQNGAPRHMALYEPRAADTSPVATRAGFATELAKRGFDHAVEIYTALHGRDGTFVLSESDLNAWGYELLRSDKQAAGVEIFKLGVSLYPNASNLHDSLAEGYEALDNKPAAIASYQKSLELDPKNGHAADRLKVLR